MVFNLLLLLILISVAVFHLTQGLFSATISAFIAVLAAVVALSYHETLAQLLVSRHKFPDIAASIALVVLFAAAYIIPRLAFDFLVPGNVRYPVWVDRIGSGVMGIVAGLMTSGILAIAAQALPFGVTIAGSARFDTHDQPGSYQGYQQMIETVSHDATVGDNFDPNQESHLWMGEDDLVVGLTEKLSDDGALADDLPMDAVHPNFLRELFGQRLGIQVSARHTLTNPTNQPNFAVAGVYTQDLLTLVDGEPPDLKLRDTPLPLMVDHEAGQTILIVRVVFTGQKDLTDDADGLFRLSPGSVRLVCGHEDDRGAEYRNYFPLALLNPRGVAVSCRIDDFFFLSTDGTRTLDFIFLVDDDHAFNADKSKKPPFWLSSGAFLSIKRYGFADLSGMKVDYGPPPNGDKVGILRPAGVNAVIARTEVTPLQEPPGILAPGAPTPSGTMLGDSGLKYLDLSFSDSLADPIPVHGEIDPNGEVALADVRGDLHGRKWYRLKALIDTSAPPASTEPSDLIDGISHTPDQVVLQLHCNNPSAGNPQMPMAWAFQKSVSGFEILDSDGNSYKPSGFWTQIDLRVKDKVLGHALAVSYGNYVGNNQALEEIAPSPGVPSNVFIAFVVPRSATIRELRLNGNTVLENLKMRAN